MNDIHQQHRINLEASQVNDQGVFEILAITAGDGNGWKFSADSLQRSVPLWDASRPLRSSLFGNSCTISPACAIPPKWDENTQASSCSCPDRPLRRSWLSWASRCSPSRRAAPGRRFLRRYLVLCQGQNVQEFCAFTSTWWSTPRGAGSSSARSIKSFNNQERIYSYGQPRNRKTNHPSARHRSPCPVWNASSSDRDRQESRRNAAQRAGKIAELEA